MPQSALAASPVESFPTEKSPLLTGRDNHLKSTGDNIQTLPDNQHTDTDNSLKILNTARWYIYVSHTVCQFSEQAWQFALLLFLTALGPHGSLRLVSSYGLVAHLAVFVAGAPTCRFLIDQCPRWWTARVVMTSQTVAVILATILAYVALGMDPTHESNQDHNPLGDDDENTTKQKIPIVTSSSYHYWIILAGIHVFGPLAQILDKTFLVAMERDWIPQMSYTLQQQQEQAAPTPAATIHASDDKNKSSSSSTVWLAETNATMKQIDLTCQITAQAVAGWIIGVFDHTARDYTSDVGGDESDSDASLLEPRALQGAAILVGILNVLSLVVEYVCTAHVYRTLKVLREQDTTNDDSSDDKIIQSKDSPNTNTIRIFYKSLQSSSKTSSSSLEDGRALNRNKPLRHADSEDSIGNEKDIPTDSSLTSTTNESYHHCHHYPRSPMICHCLHHHQNKEDLTTNIQNTNNNTRNSRQPSPYAPWITYFQQPIAASAGLGLSLLYVNSLTFGALMTAYLVSGRGMHVTTVGLWRGFSSAIGLSGTWVYRAYMNQGKKNATPTKRNPPEWRLPNAGMWSITYQFACLTMCVVSFGIRAYQPAMVLLIAGTCASRIGLWVFDIAVTQMMQELIPLPIRGVVGGAQQSLNALFQLTSFGMGLVFPDPSDFYIYGLVGFAGVGVAMVLYYFGVYRQRGTLFPPTT